MSPQIVGYFKASAPCRSSPRTDCGIPRVLRANQLGPARDALLITRWPFLLQKGADLPVFADKAVRMMPTRRRLSYGRVPMPAEGLRG